MNIHLSKSVNMIAGIVFLLSQNLYAATSTGADVNFHGTLVDEPCTIAPDDTDIHLEFGTIIDKGLYTNVRTSSMPFTIHLEDCNTTSLPDGGTVVVHFEGAEDANMGKTGYLATTDPTIGIGIGIEQEDGTFLGLNKDSSPVTLANGSIALNFQAFVEAEPDAIANKTIKLGDFSSTTTFLLNYP